MLIKTYSIILYIFLSHMHKQLNYQQFTLYWVDALSYAVFIKVLHNLIARYLLYSL